MFFNTVCADRMLCTATEFVELIGYDQLISGVGDGDGLGTSTSFFLVNSSKKRAVVADEEGNVEAARNWLRGNCTYQFVRVLPQLGNARWPCRKTRLVVCDGTRTNFLLTVCPVARWAVAAAAASSAPSPSDRERETDRLRLVQRLMAGLDPTVFAPAECFEVVRGRAFVVRKIYKNGSVMDEMYNGPSLSSSFGPLDSGGAKYRGGGRVMEEKRIAAIGRKVLVIMHVCYSYGIPVASLLSPGNLLFTDAMDDIVLSDLEDVLIGATRIPALAPPPLDDDDLGEQTDKTNLATTASHYYTSVDVLLFGALLLRLGSGSFLTGEQLASLLCCQKDHFNRQSLPREVELLADEERAAGHPLAKLEASSVAVKSTSLRNVLHYIFHPTEAADLRVLLKHSFFAFSGKATGDIDLPHIHMKKKEVELFATADAKWRAELAERETRRARVVSNRMLAREQKKKGTSSSSNRGSVIKDRDDGSGGGVVAAAPPPPPLQKLATPPPAKYPPPPPPAKKAPPPPPPQLSSQHFPDI